MASTPPRPKRSWYKSAWIPAFLFIFALAGGYVAADIYDVAPGPLTNSAQWPDPEPFPTPDLPTSAPEAQLSPDSDAPFPSSDELEGVVNEFATDPHVGANPGVLIVDAATRQVLAGLNAHQPQVPASTTKLLTAIAVLKTAGPHYQFTTTVVDGAESNPEAITLVAGGDLTLSEKQGEVDAVLGHGGIADLAEQTARELKSQGRTSVPFVTVDTTLWPKPARAQRWEDVDFTEGWIIPMDPMAINLGKIKGQMTRSGDPAGQVTSAFIEALEEHGITTDEGAKRGEKAPTASELASVASAPLGELVDYMLVYSDNVLAEALGRLTAIESGKPATFAGVEEAIKDALEDLSIPIDGLVLADASGLSSVNRISPETLVAALGVLDDSENRELLAAARGLPIAGLEGTLRNRMQDSLAAGAVAVKTGTLRSTAAIAGQVHTVDGRILHIAVMTHGWEGSLTHVRNSIDGLLIGLAECGC